MLPTKPSGKSAVISLMAAAALVGGMWIALANPFAADQDLSGQGSDLLPGESAPLADAEPISETNLVDAVPPGALAQEVSVDAVADMAKASASVKDGEKFGLEFLHLLVETQQPIDTERVIDELLVAEPPPEVSQFISSTLAREYSSGVGRHWLTDRETWIRSSATGSNAGSTIQMEVAFHQETALFPGDVEWPLLRVDIVREGDRWAVQNLSSSIVDPYNRPELEPVLSLHLEGSGWRLVNPTPAA